MPHGKTQGRYDTVILRGWHLFLPFRLISGKHWYMLLAYQKAQIINTRFSFIPVCSVLFFLQRALYWITGIHETEWMWRCHYVLSAGACATELSPAPFCLPSRMGLEVQRLPPGTSQMPISVSSPAGWARHFHEGLLGTEGKGKYKAFLCGRLGLAVCHRFSSFPFCSCSILMEELNSCVFLVSHRESFRQLISFCNLRARILKISGLFKGIREEVSWYKLIKLHWRCTSLLGLSEACWF